MVLTKKSFEIPYYLSNKRMKTDEIVSIVILILLTVFLLYPENVVLFGHTILGKMIAVFLIIVATCLDVISGILVCLLVIFFYENSIVEGMLNTMASADPDYQAFLREWGNKKKTSSPKTEDGLDVFDWMSEPSDFQQEDTSIFSESFFTKSEQNMSSIKYNEIVDKKITTEVEIILPKIDIR